MASQLAISPGETISSPAEPLLEAGDRLSRDEFERRYEAMPHLKKAELIEGIVYMPSPVRVKHARPHGRLSMWLGTYALETPGVEFMPDATVRLDWDNEPQPDLVLIKSAKRRGATRISEDDYIEGAPELAVEIAGSSRAYDLNQKKGAYRRNGVAEYIAWVTDENRLFWWQFRDGEYKEIPADSEGIVKSTVFPGLWLDVKALLAGDMKSVMAALRRGLESAEYKAFAQG